MEDGEEEEAGVRVVESGEGEERDGEEMKTRGEGEWRV